jgi:putative phosphoribosyl transferase
VALEREVQIPVAEGGVVVGDLVVPDGASAVVVFAHGSGSSRSSPRNRRVADGLQARGLATLLLDLLTADEEDVDLRTRQWRFDIALLARRLQLAAEQLSHHAATATLPLGYFGASTGAAAALVAATNPDARVTAVVSRGGRPDLAAQSLPQVRAATLLIVGGRDPAVLDLNRQAMDAMVCERDLVVVDGATHLFEEPGALAQVTTLAGDWFVRQLTPHR